MEESIKDPNGVLPGKTIFFCLSIAHARRIERLFDALYPEYKGELAKVIVSDDPRVYGKGGLLHQFTHSRGILSKRWSLQTHGESRRAVTAALRTRP
jgi:type I restriction enzyme R subunit